ncbi:MAG: hypothetical protein AB7S26_23190 [Sandaracinaceae bacterium]
MKRTGWLMVSLALVACGGGGGGSEGGGGDDTAGDEDTDMDAEAGDTVHASAIELIGFNPPEQPWEDMSHEEREFDMIGRFHPIFREVFQNKDAERWAEFGCETCHGPDMRERNFAMPSTHLPPIPAPGSERYNRARGVLTDMYSFMETEVTAHMGTMLGMPDFTCQGCHPTAE